MLNILTAAGVIACGLIVVSAAMWVIVQDIRRRPAARELATAIEEAVVAERPEWLYGHDGRAMAMPRKRPVLQTRSTRNL